MSRAVGDLESAHNAGASRSSFAVDKEKDAADDASLVRGPTSSGEEATSTDASDWWGLRSKDPVVRSRSQQRCALCTCCTTLTVLLLTFLVVIPAVVTDMVNGSQLQMVGVTIASPTNTSFHSTTVQKFTHDSGGSLKVQAALGDTNINWAAPDGGGGGGTTVKLTGGSRFPVQDNKQASMTATAQVVNTTALTDFTTYSVSAASAVWALAGSVDVFLLGTKTSVNLDKSTTVSGFDNFPVSPLVTGMNVTGGTESVLFSSMDAVLTNVGSITLALGQSLLFEAVSDGIVVGVGEIADCTLYTGTFPVRATVNLTYSDAMQYDQIMRLLSNYSSAVPSPVSMRSFFTRDPVTWLAPALQSIAMNSSVPGVITQFVLQISLYMHVDPLDVPYSMIMVNTEPTAITITSIQGYVTYEGEEIASVDNTGLQIIMPALGNTTTPQLPTSPAIDGPAVAAFEELKHAGSGLGNAIVNISMTIGEFEAQVQYVQYNVSIIIVPIGG